MKGFLKKLKNLLTYPLKILKKIRKRILNKSLRRYNKRDY